MLAQITAEAIANNPVNVKVGKKYYKIHAPTPFTLSRMVLCISNMEAKDKTLIDAIKELPDGINSLNRFIAYAMVGDNRIKLFDKILLKRALKSLNRLSNEERVIIIEEIFKLIDLKSFFLCARSVNQIRSLLAKQ